MSSEDGEVPEYGLDVAIFSESGAFTQGWLLFCNAPESHETCKCVSTGMCENTSLVFKYSAHHPTVSLYGRSKTWPSFPNRALDETGKSTDGGEKNISLDSSSAAEIAVVEVYVCSQTTGPLTEYFKCAVTSDHRSETVACVILRDSKSMVFDCRAIVIVKGQKIEIAIDSVVMESLYNNLEHVGVKVEDESLVSYEGRKIGCDTCTPVPHCIAWEFLEKQARDIAKTCARGSPASRSTAVATATVTLTLCLSPAPRNGGTLAFTKSPTFVVHAIKYDMQL